MARTCASQFRDPSVDRSANLTFGICMCKSTVCCPLLKHLCSYASCKGYNNVLYGDSNNFENPNLNFKNDLIPEIVSALIPNCAIKRVARRVHFSDDWRSNFSQN